MNLEDIIHNKAIRIYLFPTSQHQNTFCITYLKRWSGSNFQHWVRALTTEEWKLDGTSSPNPTQSRVSQSRLLRTMSSRGNAMGRSSYTQQHLPISQIMLKNLTIIKIWFLRSSGILNLFISRADAWKDATFSLSLLHSHSVIFSIHFPQLISTVHQAQALQKNPSPPTFFTWKIMDLALSRSKLPWQSLTLCPKGQHRAPLGQRGGSKSTGWGLINSARLCLLKAGNPRGVHLRLQTLPRGNSWTHFKVMAHIPWQGRAQILLACTNCWEPQESLLLLTMTN